MALFMLVVFTFNSIDNYFKVNSKSAYHPEEAQLQVYSK